MPCSNVPSCEARILNIHSRNDLRYHKGVGSKVFNWLIYLVDRKGVLPKKPYIYFWSEVGVARKSQG